MSNHNFNNCEFNCRGPQTDVELDKFEAIALAFPDNMAQEPSIDRQPGTPFYTEFVTTTAYDENGVGNRFEPVRLGGFVASHVLAPDLAAGMADAGELEVGVGNNDQLFNAQMVLFAVGFRTGAELHPDHERLDFSD